MKLEDETVRLHRFARYVPTPDTEGLIDELPFLAGQGVGLVHAAPSVSEIIESLMADAVSALVGLTSAASRCEVVDGLKM